MNNTIRRIILCLGAALLVGAWGLTRYAAQHDIKTNITGKTGSYSLDGTITTVWDREFSNTKLKGVGAMALGAGLIAFAIPRPKDKE